MLSKEETIITQIDIVEERSTHKLDSPEDWWTMVMGVGLRNTIKQLEPLARQRVQEANLKFLQETKVDSLEVDVLYAIATKK